MALDPLATAPDLAARNITVPDGFDADTILAAASAAVRDAAGCPISETDSTVVLVADDYRWLDLPGGPVTDVDTVLVDGDASTSWTRYGDSLKWWAGWWTGCLPVNVTVTYTHGFAAVPADIVDLVCGIAAMAFAQDGDYSGAGRTASVKLGDFAESYNHTAGTDSPSPLAIPDKVRDRLRARFGTSVAVVGVRK